MTTSRSRRLLALALAGTLGTTGCAAITEWPDHTTMPDVCKALWQGPATRAIVGEEPPWKAVQGGRSFLWSSEVRPDEGTGKSIVCEWRATQTRDGDHITVRTVAYGLELQSSFKGHLEEPDWQSDGSRCEVSGAVSGYDIRLTAANPRALLLRGLMRIDDNVFTLVEIQTRKRVGKIGLAAQVPRSRDATAVLLQGVADSFGVAKAVSMPAGKPVCHEG
ncbi:hypothetical protein AB0B45_23535 [Nonomuraea sp. NPDC049152]|uniref:hypothetical protein n=1 Tax=Nonomuraea sp. NPDC049152 TaxID=3154350 RepID=UPI0033C3BF0B